MKQWTKLSVVSAAAALLTLSASANYQIDTSASWTFSVAGTVSLPGYFNQFINANGIPVSVNQLSNPMDVDNDDEDDFQIVVPLGGGFPLGFLEFGLFNDWGFDYVRADSVNPGPFIIPAGTILSFPGFGNITVPVDVRISNVRVNAVGLITTQTFGGVPYITKVTGIGGSPTDPDESWVTADVEAFIGGSWQSLGTAEFEITRWVLVPEPASMVVLGSGLLGLLALRRRKR